MSGEAWPAAPEVRDETPDDLTPLDLDVLEAQLRTLGWLEQDKVLVAPAIAMTIKSVHHLRRMRPEVIGWHGGEPPVPPRCAMCGSERRQHNDAVCGAFVEDHAS